MPGEDFTICMDTCWKGWRLGRVCERKWEAKCVCGRFFDRRDTIFKCEPSLFVRHKRLVELPPFIQSLRIWSHFRLMALILYIK